MPPKYYKQMTSASIDQSKESGAFTALNILINNIYPELSYFYRIKLRFMVYKWKTDWGTFLFISHHLWLDARHLFDGALLYTLHDQSDIVFNSKMLRNRCLFILAKPIKTCVAWEGTWMIEMIKSGEKGRQFVVIFIPENIGMHYSMIHIS